jgi:hypothetical protein
MSEKIWKEGNSFAFYKSSDSISEPTVFCVPVYDYKQTLRDFLTVHKNRVIEGSMVTPYKHLKMLLLFIILMFVISVGLYSTLNE